MNISARTTTTIWCWENTGTLPTERAGTLLPSIPSRSNRASDWPVKKVKFQNEKLRPGRPLDPNYWKSVHARNYAEKGRTTIFPNRHNPCGYKGVRTHQCDTSSPQISTMLFTHLIFVFITLPLGFKRATATWCDCAKPWESLSGQCDDDTPCTPCCGYGPW
jgi:hypothetical protein